MATFNRLDASDFVISADAISSTCWTNGNPTLTEFYTSSIQANGSSGYYYINVIIFNYIYSIWIIHKSELVTKL